MVVVRVLFFSTVVMASLFPHHLAAKPYEPPSVVFLSPDNSRFWQLVSGFMTAVADDLDINLTIHTDQQKHRFSYRQLLSQVLENDHKPDYILLMCKEKVTEDMLRMIDDAGIKAFTFNTDVPNSEAATTGKPREKIDHWIGHLSPDNQSAGRELALYLNRRFVEKNIASTPALIGISGSRDSSAALDRNIGLDAAAKTFPSMLNQVVFANWSEKEAEDKVGLLLMRYPSVNLIWAASDGMAVGAINAVKKKGLTPGQDVLIGGVDWEPRALRRIESGDLTVSLGRHFMGGGLALLLINDYHAGYDFASTTGNASISYDFEIANRSNLSEVRQIMKPDNWSRIDFREFSKAFSTLQRSRNPSASDILDGFMTMLSNQQVSRVAGRKIDSEL